MYKNFLCSHWLNLDLDRRNRYLQPRSKWIGWYCSSWCQQARFRYFCWTSYCFHWKCQEYFWYLLPRFWTNHWSNILICQHQNNPHSRSTKKSLRIALESTKMLKTLGSTELKLPTVLNLTSCWLLKNTKNTLSNK